MEATDDIIGFGLRSLAAGRHRRGDLCDLRVQLHPSPYGARLAQLWGVLSVHCRAVHRDVRLPADDLSALGLATESLPWCEPALAQQWAPLGDAVRLERGSAPQPDSLSE